MINFVRAYRKSFFNVIRIKALIVLCFIFLLLNSCKQADQSVDRAFYYWKTTYSIPASQKQLLQKLSVKKIYLRLFDVEWDTKRQQPMPVQQIRFISPVDTFFNYTPVIYIVNNVFQHMATEDVHLFAKRIQEQVEHIGSANQFDFTEIQLDCDWTESTAKNYFELIRLLKENTNKKGTLITATIRLHQVKYAERTGVPPVDRGMLMFYNMGKINRGGNANSIYNFKEAERYVHFVDKYPLPLDAALPVFSWGIHLRNNATIGLVNDISFETIEKNHYFRMKGLNVFTTDSSFFYHGIYFVKGDELRMEEISPDICFDAASQLSKSINEKNKTVSLFDLDSLNIIRYDENDFEKIFSCFN